MKRLYPETLLNVHVAVNFLSQVIFFFFCFWVWQCMLMKLKQRKNKNTWDKKATTTYRWFNVQKFIWITVITAQLMFPYTLHGFLQQVQDNSAEGWGTAFRAVRKQFPLCIPVFAFVCRNAPVQLCLPNCSSLPMNTLLWNNYLKKTKSTPIGLVLIRNKYFSFLLISLLLRIEAV